VARKIIYTVLLNGYDDFRCSALSEGFDHYIFTDNLNLYVEGWNVILVKPKPDIKKQSREIKINIHKFIKADIYVYLDANYELVSDISHFVRSYFDGFGGGFLTVRHPSRACMYQEADKIIELGKADESVVNKQVEAYRLDGKPNNARLFACGFFIRDQSFNKFCEKWYKEVEKHCHRDQLSFAYLVWKEKPQMIVADWSLLDPVLRLHPHKNGTSIFEAPKIWYFVPGCGKKDLGTAINRHCALVPSDNDWILVRDNDTAFLHPFINKQLEDIIAKHGKDYDLLSCYTNRLGLQHQLPYGLMGETDILKLHDLAEKHYAEHYDEVIESDSPTAGLFMLFKKSTWRKNPFVRGLASNGDFIDYQFANGLKQQGARIGICSGVFMYHYYRSHQSNSREHRHLMA
jgi:hypothetical protein